MIAKITGKLISLAEDSGLVEVGPIAYEVMLPGYCITELSGKIDSEITLCTSQYYEGTPGGGNLIPRLIGFLSADEKKFFSLYTSVKGMGIKKGLKSLALPINVVASAIEAQDEKVIISLPGIGKRLAQHIIAELAGKLDSYAFAAESSDGKKVALNSGFKPFQTEALEILIAWGEKRNDVIEYINLAQQKHPNIVTAEELVPAVYRLKQGVEV